jgi:hypothetical protein
MTRQMAVCTIWECQIPEALAALQNRLPQEEDEEVLRYLRAWLRRWGMSRDDPRFWNLY